MDYSFEEEVLANLAIHVKSKSIPGNTESVIRAALDDASYLDQRNTELLGDKTFHTWKVGLMSTSFAPYYYGGGACGGYSLFLARLLKKMGYHIKTVQVKVNGKYGGHITLGVVDGNRLLLVDPLYDLYYKDSLGHMVDIHEVAKNWSYYVKQVPPNYNHNYDYQSGWRYTNWDKLGIISRGIYKVGVKIFGKERVDNYAFTDHFSALSRNYFILSFLGFILFTSFLVWELYKHQKFRTWQNGQKKKEAIPDSQLSNNF